jgi:hypothetical protein
VEATGAVATADVLEAARVSAASQFGAAGRVTGMDM